jgi:hypothetical protein
MATDHLERVPPRLGNVLGVGTCGHQKLHKIGPTSRAALNQGVNSTYALVPIASSTRHKSKAVIDRLSHREECDKTFGQIVFCMKLMIMLHQCISNESCFRSPNHACSFRGPQKSAGYMDVGVSSLQHTACQNLTVSEP